MTQIAVKHHQNFDGKAIKNKDFCLKFKKKIIFGTARISHFEIARLFDLNPALIAGALDDFRAQDGQHDTVYKIDMLRWADETAFYSVATELNLPEYLMQAVLASLGHFPRANRQLDAADCEERVAW